MLANPGTMKVTLVNRQVSPNRSMYSHQPVEPVAVGGDQAADDGALLRLPLGDNESGDSGDRGVPQLVADAFDVVLVELGVGVEDDDTVVVVDEVEFLNDRFDRARLTAVGQQFQDVDTGLGGDFGGGVARTVRHHVDVPAVEESKGGTDSAVDDGFSLCAGMMTASEMVSGSVLTLGISNSPVSGLSTGVGVRRARRDRFGTGRRR